MEINPALEAQVGAWAEAQLSPERVTHVRGVVTTAARLAARYAPQETSRVRLAAWIHDVAKDWDDARLLAYAEAQHLPITPTEREVPLLLHGAVSYALAAERFDLDDPLLRDEMAAAGPERAARFSWQRAARETLSVYRSIMQP